MSNLFESVKTIPPRTNLSQTTENTTAPLGGSSNFNISFAHLVTSNYSYSNGVPRTDTLTDPFQTAMKAPKTQYPLKPKPIAFGELKKLDLNSETMFQPSLPLCNTSSLIPMMTETSSKVHKFKADFMNPTTFDSPKCDTIMNHSYGKFQKTLEGCERKKLPSSIYTEIVDMIHKTDEEAVTYFLKQEQPQYDNYSKLNGLIYVIKVGSSTKRPPSVGLKFRSYKGGHYTSCSRDTPVICKVFVCT